MKVVDNSPFILYMKCHISPFYRGLKFILFSEFLIWYAEMYSARHTMKPDQISVLEENWKIVKFCVRNYWRIVHNFHGEFDCRPLLLNCSISCNFLIPCQIWFKFSVINWNLSSNLIKGTWYEGFGFLEFWNFVYKFWSLHLALSDKTNKMKIGQEMREKLFLLFLE